MKKRVIISVLAGVLLLAGGIFAYTESHKASLQKSDVNFTEIGNLTFNTPGINPNAWYLVFEQPGQPALFNMLKFDSNSVCMGGPCPGNISVGERVKVEGVATTSIVLVRNISTDISEGNNLSIALFHYNPLNDLIPGTTHLACSSAGLVQVSRVIPKTNAPIVDAINLLLRGEISPDEKVMGITTEFPLSGLKATGASLKDGILTLIFNDPNNSTNGGDACRTAVLWAEIEATAKQFPGVNEVKFQPSTLFQH